MEKQQAKKALKKRGVMTGTLVGGVIGATASLLLAPKAGKELRSDISAQTNAVKDKSKQFSGNTKTKLSNLKNSTSERSQKLAKKFKKSKDQDAADEAAATQESSSESVAADTDNSFQENPSASTETTISTDDDTTK
ncbi:YtxH domain-containing protein [Thalassobacillus pellis]|uniref:YtxH domain-containing protein n=1 Tax=Thalassobacillus pellis TaxID=748008 RepID=UPI00196135FA|nr:YtxH domain-containing protein [Thalassobacillus pellis]MBM7551302.1 gas vesicle protein [Thalassobacillus pellis]